MKRASILVGLAVVLLGGAAGGYVLYTKWEGRDVRGSPTVEFVPTDVPDPPPPPGRQRARPRKALVARVTWPTYGFDSRRLRFVPELRLRPPFRKLWMFRGRALLEFPPAVAHGRLYLPTFDGRFYALDARTGKPRWLFNSNRCSWASPAVANGVIYETFLNSPTNCNVQSGPLAGEVVALDEKTGRVRWLTRLPPTESSPLVANGLVYVGDWSGAVSALDIRTGKVRWRSMTNGPVKGSVALAGGRIFVGSYDGHLYALNARSGKQIWRASSQARLGSHGEFYSTPAVAYGRVYIGSTDGKVYSFGAKSGRLRWSKSTGWYVYSSPAIWRELVLVGSHDSDFYALDAATGDVRWKFHANGPVSGAPTVLDGIVYFSTTHVRTYALNARTGRLLWSFPDGQYSPVVTDGRRIYLVGYSRLYGMAPLRSS